MQIIQTSKPELTRKELYFLTKSPDVRRMSDCASQRIEVANWCIFEDVNNGGEKQRLVLIQTPEGESLLSNSATFVNDFESLLDIFADELDNLSIEVVERPTRNGNTAIGCVFAA